MTGPVGPYPGFLRDFAETRGFLLGRPSRIQPTPDGRSVLFLRGPARDPVLGLFELDVATGETRELITPRELLGGATEDLSDAERARRERMRITESGFTWFELSADGRQVLLLLSGRLFVLDRNSRRTRVLVESTDKPVLAPHLSPDGRCVAFVRGHDLWVVGVDGSDPPRALTSGGSEDVMHGLPEFVAQEEMARHEGYWWSPDGAFIAYAEVDQSAVDRFSISDPAHPERPPQHARYPRPGRANAHVRLGVVAVGISRAIPTTRWIVWDDAHFPYLARVLWDTPKAALTLLVQTRDQREVALLSADPSTGATTAILTDTDDAWVNLDRTLPRWLPDGSGFLWGTERSGRAALELHRPDGSLDRVVVDGPADLLGLVHITPASDAVHVLLGDAVSNRLLRVPLTGGSPVTLTTDQAEHTPVFSAGGSIFVDARVAVDAWPEATIHRAGDGVCIGRLPHVAETPPFTVNVELTTVGSERSFHAAVVRPRAFDAGRRYPVVVFVYGGPHSLMVRSDQRHYLLAQWLADHGAIVVSIDNRGTPRRDRAWERAIKGNFGDIPLGDQIDGLFALGQRFPQIDLSRVGIYGWSFGGTMAALAVLRRPDVFKVAVAGAPVVDWRDYDTHYTERYLGLPDENPDGYRMSSPLSYAAGLTRPLLLIHGTADDNVYAFHSFKLVDALFRAGRPFDFLPLAGVTHQTPDPQVRASLWLTISGFLLSQLGDVRSPGGKVVQDGDLDDDLL